MVAEITVYGRSGFRTASSQSRAYFVLRTEHSGLFFVNVQYVFDPIAALVSEHKPRVLALDFSRVPDIEYSALQMLEEGEKRLTERSITVWFVGLNPDALKVIRRAGMDKRLGPDRLLFNARNAIERYKEFTIAPAGDAGLADDATE
jgi:sulfate permease, SulP family